MLTGHSCGTRWPSGPAFGSITAGQELSAVAEARCVNLRAHWTRAKTGQSIPTKMHNASFRSAWYLNGWWKRWRAAQPLATTPRCVRFGAEMGESRALGCATRLQERNLKSARNTL